MLTLYDLFFALQVAVLGCTVSCILMQQDYILEWWLDFVLWLLEKGYKWAAYPLGYCEKCLSGQLGLWFYLALNFEYYNTDLLDTAIGHAIFIAFTIVFTIPINNYLTENEKN